MCLLIETPEGYKPERLYILGVVLGEFLGLEWRHQATARNDVRITLLGHPRGALILPDVLFKTSDANWVKAESLPLQPLSIWDSGDLKLPVTLVEPQLPVIFGLPDTTSKIDSDEIYLPIDIFGSAFFMLTRYEELVLKDRDEHNRFPAKASIAYKEGFLDRPIVDEYVEVLWTSLSALWPQLARKKRNFQILVSHDVDRPARYQFISTVKFFRALGGDVLKRRDWHALISAVKVKLGGSERLHPDDPFNTFDWIMDVSERNGLTSAFYFICGRTDPNLDAAYEPDQPAIRALMRRISERGHEIGLHPSYNTYCDPFAFEYEAKRLRKICAEEGINQTVWGGRMHYLRWEQAITPTLWNSASMTYDSTLGYADQAGFRCGTCHEYSCFDLGERTKLDLKLRPMIAMEGSLFAKEYMGLTDQQATDYILKLRSRAELMNGLFTLLWHNSELVSCRMRKVYERVLDFDCKAT